LFNITFDERGWLFHPIFLLPNIAILEREVRRIRAY